MFICFGFLSLVKAYDFFNQMHIPFLVEQLELVQKQESQKEKERDEEC